MQQLKLRLDQGAVMNTTVRDFSISMRTTACYQQVVSNLRGALKRRGFEILCEFLIDRELDRKVGLRWEQLGLRWRVRGVEPVRCIPGVVE